MRKIATPAQLQLEIRQVMTLATKGCSRARLASALIDLANRVSEGTVTERNRRIAESPPTLKNVRNDIKVLTKWIGSLREYIEMTVQARTNLDRVLSDLLAGEDGLKALRTLSEGLELEEDPPSLPILSTRYEQLDVRNDAGDWLAEVNLLLTHVIENPPGRWRTRPIDVRTEKQLARAVDQLELYAVPLRRRLKGDVALLTQLKVLAQSLR